MPQDVLIAMCLYILTSVNTLPTAATVLTVG